MVIEPTLVKDSTSPLSPSIPLGNKKNHTKHSEVTLSGVLANEVKTFLALGKFHAIPHLIWSKVKSALDFRVDYFSK